MYGERLNVASANEMLKTAEIYAHVSTRNLCVF